MILTGLKYWSFNVLIALDQLLNAILGGAPDETISSRAGKARARGDWWGCYLCLLLDWIDPRHCETSREDDEGSNSVFERLKRDKALKGTFLMEKANMQISDAGLDLIKEFEGCKLKAYKCPANVWTIGYGHTKTAKPGMKISKDEAENLLRKDMARYEYAVERNVKVPLEQYQFDALVSFAFNCGEGNLKKITKYLNRNGGNYDIVPQRLMLYKKARVGGRLKTLKGLVRRRRAECELWRGLRGDDRPIGDMPQQVEADKPTLNNLKDSWTLKGLFLGVSSLLTALSQVFSSLDPTTRLLFILTLIALGIAAYRRWDANREGKIG